uniref:Uncharacterized protein n=1 Tax=Tanacetum cinerariifolium TaxID=118510 RepID=A0A6L2LA72_TANCI|nr:hypothetical protein [Tanacetum cinerariifolium]
MFDFPPICAAFSLRDKDANSLADACRDLVPCVDLPALLVAFSFGVLADSGSFPSLHLLDPRSGPAEGSSSLSASSRRLFRVTVSPHVSKMIYRIHMLQQRPCKGFDSIAGGLDPVNPVIRLPIERGINSGTKVEMVNNLYSEYEEYEAEKERKLWNNVRSIRSPTDYDEADFDSFQQNKSNTFNYPYSHNLPPPHPVSLPVQPYPKNYLVSTNDVDLEEAGVEDDDDGDTYDIWDITVDDVERIRQFFMPSIPDETDEVIQPLIP